MGDSLSPCDVRRQSVVATGGEIQPTWVNTYASQILPTAEEAVAVAVDRHDNSYVAGVISDNGSPGRTYCLIIKYSSAGDTLWTARYNSEDEFSNLRFANVHRPVAMSVDDSGNVYVTGFSGDTYWYHECVTVKYGPAGQRQWIVRLRSTNSGGSAKPAALTVDNAGNCYVAGSIVEDSFDQSDIFVVKYTPSGVREWIQRYDGGGYSGRDDVATAVMMNHREDIVLGGTSLGHYLLIEYDTSGQMKWLARYDSSRNSADNMLAMAIDQNDDIYVTGYSVYYDTTYPWISHTDCATAKFTATGIQEWDERHSVSSSDAPLGIASDDLANMYVAETDGGFIVTSKYDTNGELQWSVPFSGPNNGGNQATAIAIDSSGNIHVSGFSQGVANGTAVDYVLLRYSVDGILQWTKRYNGDGNDVDKAVGVAISQTGSVYVTGTSIGWRSLSDIATIRYTSDGTRAWLARYDGPRNSLDHASSVAVDDSGNAYVTGNSSGDYLTLKCNRNGEREWETRYHVQGKSNPTAIAVDHSGHVYVTGYDVGTSYGSNPDYMTVKYGHDGSKKWVARYDGPQTGYYGSSDRAASLVIDDFGNTFVTGSSEGDIVTVKYDTNGVQQWVDRYEGQGVSEPVSIAMDPSGNVLVTGFTTDSTLSYPRVNENFLTIKFGSDGTRLWAVRFDGPAGRDDRPVGLGIDKSGNVYVTGSCYRRSTGGTDIGTVKYDSSGSLQWVRYYNGLTTDITDIAAGLALDDNGDVFVAGMTYEAANNWVVLMYDGDGTEKWERTYYLGNRGQPKGIGVDRYGYVYVSGTNEKPDFTNESILLKYDHTGNPQWVTHFSPPGYSDFEFGAMKIDFPGDVVIVGTSKRYGFSVYSTMSYSYTVLAVDEHPDVHQPSGLVLEQNFPNPFNSETTISFDLPSAGNVVLEVYDLLGRRVATLLNAYCQAGRNTLQWNSAHAATGVYYYRMQAGQSIQVKRLMIVK